MKKSTKIVLLTTIVLMTVLGNSLKNKQTNVTELTLSNVVALSQSEDENYWVPNRFRAGSTIYVKAGVAYGGVIFGLVRRSNAVAL